MPNEQEQFAEFHRAHSERGTPKVMGVKFNPTPARGRLVVVHQFYYQESGFDPIQLDPVTYSRWLSAEHQPYGPRRTNIGEEWQPIVGADVPQVWVPSEDIRMIILHNIEGSGLSVNPTPDEQATIDSKVIEVCLGDTGKDPIDWIPFAYIPPGEALPLSPMNIDLLRVRVRQGDKALCLLTVIPR